MVAVVTTYPVKGVARGVWETLLAGESGNAMSIGNRRHRITAQASGTFNDEDVSIQGSLDGTTWSTLTTDGTNPATISAAGVINIWESPTYIRPSISGASGVDIDVIIEATAAD